MQSEKKSIFIKCFSLNSLSYKNKLWNSVHNKFNIKGWNLKKIQSLQLKLKLKKILNIAIIKYKGVLIYAKILVLQTYWFHFSLNFSSAIHLLGYLWPGCLTIHFYGEVYIYIYIKGGSYIIYLFWKKKRKDIACCLSHKN
jgi:hypothetical protein